MPHMRIAKGCTMLKEKGGRGELSRDNGEGETGGRVVKNGLWLYWDWNSSEIWLRTDSTQLTCCPWAHFRLPGPCGAGVSWRCEDEVMALSATGVAAP